MIIAGHAHTYRIVTYGEVTMATSTRRHDEAYLHEKKYCVSDKKCSKL